MGHGSLFFDGSHGSWVTSCLPMTHQPQAHLIARIDTDLLNDVVVFLSVFPSIFDILEYADVPTLPNAFPVIYTLYHTWKPDSSDTDKLSLLKREFLKVLHAKYSPSLTMLHFAAIFLIHL